MSDLTKILAENQKEISKIIARAVKKPVTVRNLEHPDSEPENVFPNSASTSSKNKIEYFQNYTALGRSPPSGFSSAIVFAPEKNGRSSEDTLPSRITFTRFVTALRKFGPVCPFVWGKIPFKPARGDKKHQNDPKMHKWQ